MMTPVFFKATAAKSHLHARFTSSQRCRNAPSCASGSSFFNSLKSVIQPAPILDEISSVSRGLLSAIQRRGVTPLVLLPKRCGQSS